MAAKRAAKRKVPKARPKARAKKAKKQQYVTTTDLEDLLISEIISNDVKAVNGTDLENLIYSATPSIGMLGYDFGFSVGRELALKLGSRDKFTKALDKIGLHNALYHPFKDEVILVSKPHKGHARYSVGKNIHIYESGVIAGYLSTSAGVKVHTTERRCIYSGSNMCEFVAKPMHEKPTFTSSNIADITDAIAQNLSSAEYSKINKEYHRILAFIPLIEKPISEQVIKVMVLAGEKLGKNEDRAQVRRSISNIANYFGAKEHQVAISAQRKSIIKLRYESYNSIHEYVVMPAALVAGMANAMYREAKVKFRTNRDKSYTTVIEMKKRI